MHRSRLPLPAPSKHKKRPLSFYDKALPPPNPRYAHVGSRIDSGPTVAKLRTVTTRQFVRRKEETFARVTTSQLAALTAEYGCCSGEGEQEGGDDGELSVMSNGGSRVVVVTHDPTRNAPVYDKPYLLLDVRPEPEVFAKTRLVEARHLPPHFLRQDRIPSDILRFRNREGTLLILYDQSDGVPPAAGAMATELVLRGWENVYVLSGGLDAVASEHPHLVVGQSSAQQQQQQQQRTDESDPLRLSEANLARLSLALEGKAKRLGGVRATPVGSTTYTAGGGGKDGRPAASMAPSAAGGSCLSVRGGRTMKREVGAPPSVVSTVETGLSVAETVIARARARKGMF